MEVTAAVLYDGALAHYDVRVEDGECYAQLSEYKGGSSHRPPNNIRLIKQGRHWVSENADPSLSDELGYAVELKLKPVLESRSRRGAILRVNLVGRFQNPLCELVFQKMRFFLPDYLRLRYSIYPFISFCRNIEILLGTGWESIKYTSFPRQITQISSQAHFPLICVHAAIFAASSTHSG